MIIYESGHDSQFPKCGVPVFPILPYYLVGQSSFVLIYHPIISIFLSLPFKLRLDPSMRGKLLQKTNKKGNNVTG